MGQQLSYLQDQANAAMGSKKSNKDLEAALDKALKSADYLASRGADGIAALKDLCKQKKVGGTTLPKGWQQKIPLQGACMNSHMNTSLKFLVEEIKVDLDAPEPLSGDPPIHTAVAWGRPEVVAYLLAKGANANALDAEGLTPLQAAKRRQALLESGDAKYVNRCEEQGMDIKSLREGGKALVALLQGVADEDGYGNLSPKAKLPSYSNLFGMA